MHSTGTSCYSERILPPRRGLRAVYLPVVAHNGQGCSGPSENAHLEAIVLSVSKISPVKDPLVSTDASGTARPITTPEAWEAHREGIRARVTDIIGTPPYAAPDSRYRIVHDSDEADYRHLTVAYQVGPDEEVRAHVLIPPAHRRKRGAAVLCLHGTSPEGKDTQIGIGAKPGRDYGRYLARQGFVTFSPDHLAAGERLAPGQRAYDTAAFYARYPEWSAVGKAIWDGQRALDVLVRFAEVDPQRIGAVGHSLGGHGSIFVAAFDERVRATVSSCGLTIWANNPQRLKWARDSWYSYFPRRRPIFLSLPHSWPRVPC